MWLYLKCSILSSPYLLKQSLLRAEFRLYHIQCISRTTSDIFFTTWMIFFRTYRNIFTCTMMLGERWCISQPWIKNAKEFIVSCLVFSLTEPEAWDLYLSIICHCLTFLSSLRKILYQANQIMTLLAFEQIEGKNYFLFVAYTYNNIRSICWLNAYDNIRSIWVNSVKFLRD